MLAINEYSNSLIQQDGIWHSKEQTSISYPKDGHDMCFELEDNSFWFIHRNKCIESAIRNYPPPLNDKNGQHECIFDIGGGNGFVSQHLIKQGYDACLVEAGIQGILNAQKRELPNLICSSFEQAGFKQGSIGAIGLFDVLEHIEQDVTFLEKLCTVMKNQGRLYMTVPSYQFLWSSEDVSAGHFRRYTLTGLMTKLIEVGFTINFKTYFFSHLMLPVWLLRALPYKLGFQQQLFSTKKSHQKRSGILNALFSQELKCIKSNKSIPCGSSCLIVACKA